MTERICEIGPLCYTLSTLLARQCRARVVVAGDENRDQKYNVKKGKRKREKKEK